MGSGIKSWFADTNMVVYCLVMVFAISSWIDISGLWVELPLLVNELPEGWDLPSYLAIIIQIANIGPLFYTVLLKVAGPRRVKEWIAVYVIILVGMVACVVLIFFWKVTTVVGGTEHSTVLLCLTTALALVDCTSSVVFLPYMYRFKIQYMSAFYIGEGLSGLLPGVVGLIQGVGSDPSCVNSSSTVHNETTNENTTTWNNEAVYPNPTFSVSYFFFFLFATLCSSAIAFTCLHFHPKCQQAKVNKSSYDFSTSVPNPEQRVDVHIDDNISMASNQTDQTSVYGENDNKNILRKRGSSNTGKAKKRLWLLFLVAWVNCLTNGILPSIQSYSCLPYSNTVYSLTVRLSSIANPLACFMAIFIQVRRLRFILLLCAVGSSLAIYHIVLAFLSPHPPLQGHLAGEILAVSTGVLLTGVFSFVKLAIAMVFREEKSKKGLLWCGILTQVGSFVGAGFAFLLVNVAKVFEAAYDDPCP